MPVYYCTADEVRAAEAATGDLLTGGTLMARAAHGVAQAVLTELRGTGGCYGRSVGLVIGAGNNGGDALYAGAELRRRGVAVTAVLLAPDQTHEGGLAALRRAGGRIVASLPAGLDAVVDGVVGIGGRGPLRPAATAVFAALDPSTTVVAVDLPSGVDADTGVIHSPAVRADVTVTFGVLRRAHLLAAEQCGRVTVIDIGLGAAGDGSVAALTDADVAAAWPVPGPHDDKYTQGVVGIVAGSQQYPGAAVLCTGGAVAATSGMTRFVGTAAPQVVAHRPEVVAVEKFDDAGRVQAWVVGPGLGVDEKAEATVERVVAADVPVLVDADGLTVLARRPDLLSGRTAPTLLTPHAGEFARLAGAPVGSDRLTATRELAAQLGATVLLKGRITLVADPAGQVYGNDAGSSWAATAGAGDVLSGIAGALLAAGRSPLVAGAAAARVHARAAQTAARGVPIGASDLLGAVPTALRDLLVDERGATGVQRT
ncbi:NAD(P)H-hydrate dehydratase [Gordonia alkaliphila]|uniref:NAD(P)H-hydrate dehydratase n=1 Tax=Gordonia alkaliphila TaxID=1053547 RepID=UPI001FF38071|nr:NAD(P)H-hydrate dehydratase [Gordonia alkaliphila]MCK0439917.1 NAD(P)H-hydrate dehydratase [Gordonia alkaliphila]